MSSNTIGLFLRHLALSEEVSQLAAASDSDLLAAYEAGRGQAAFSELMRRHGPMVLRTCRRVLGHKPDVEDAFQATFVLLARRAADLRAESSGPLSLGGWLHRVAYRTAVNVSAEVNRRRVRERQASVMTTADPDPVHEATWNEVRPILDAELDALPADARRLLVACYLQGKTHAEAAAEFGLPTGSVAWRLERARELLAERLRRRGIAVSASLLAVLLAAGDGTAGVPAVLLVHSVEAAVTFTEQSTGVVSDSVAELVKGGLTKMKTGSAYAGLAAVGWATLLGAGLIVGQTLMARADDADCEAPAARTTEQTEPAAEGPLLTDRFGDPLPRGALARLGSMRLRSASGGQQSVAFTRDGRGVITGSRGNPTRLWDLATGKLVRQFGDNCRLESNAVALSPDGRTLAGRGGRDGGLHVWDVESGKLLAEGDGGPVDIIHLAFSPDGKQIASAGNDGKLRLWESNGVVVWVQAVAGGSPLAVDFGADGKTVTLVTGKTVSSWDTITGKKVSQGGGLGRTAGFATILSGGGTLAVTNSSIPEPKEPAKEPDGIVRLVDLSTLKEVRQLNLEKVERGIQTVAFDAKGKVLAAVSGMGEIHLCALDTGAELRRCQGGKGFPDSLAFSADGATLAGTDRGTVRLWDVASGKELTPVQGGHRQVVSSVAFTADGGLVSSGWDGSVREWDVATGRQRRSLSLAGGEPGDCVHASMSSVVTPDGATVASVGLCVKKMESIGCDIRLWDRSAGRERASYFKDLGQSLPGTLALSPDGRVVACVPGTESEVQLWESATGNLLAKFPGTLPAFSPDGKLLAAARPANEPLGVTIRETGTARELCVIPLAANVQVSAFSPDGRTLAVACSPVTSAKCSLHLFPLLKDDAGKSGLRTGPARLVTEELSAWPRALVFSPDGRTLAVPGEGNSIRLLETASGKERIHFSGHVGEVWSLAFSADGRRVASGSLDTTILVWDATGRLSGGRLSAASAKDREDRWAELVGDDAVRAWHAVRALADEPEQTVTFLSDRLRPVARLAPDAATKLIRELDDDAFDVRSKARKELERLGPVAETALRQARQKATSIEVQRTLDSLLAGLDEQKKCLFGEVLRTVRAAEVLERIGTPAARRLLTTLAGGSPDACLTQEARAALDHLTHAEKR
jgi:RNA polymerase sigma factor (sigma-70 family)